MRILVVDDSLTMRRYIANELQQSGFEVIEAANGKTALDIYGTTDLDLITLDVDMPEMNGFEFCESLRKQERRENPTPVMFVTGNDTLKDRDRGFELGAVDFVTKPPRPGSIASRARKILKLEPSFSGFTALAVDDISISRLIVANCLSEFGIKVLQANNGATALEILRNPENKIDLIITDFMMPVMDGKELCRNIRTVLGMTEVPVIFLSAIAEQKEILNIFNVGATDYILKPFTKEELNARVTVHLNNFNLQKMLDARVKELERLNQLKNDFIGVASHDLKSPLSCILGFTDIMQNKANLPEEFKKPLQYVMSSGNFLLSIIDDILDLVRIESQASTIELTPLSLFEVVDNAINAMVFMASPKNIQIEKDFVQDTEQPLTINGHFDSLMRITNNLVSNAIKFTRAGGRVTIKIAKHNEKRLGMTVTDNGVGIPADKIPLLFQKFSKASQKGTAGEKSTGLGLAIVKELVEKHLGSIEVESQEGAGTSFRILLPLVAVK